MGLSKKIKKGVKSAHKISNGVVKIGTDTGKLLKKDFNFQKEIYQKVQDGAKDLLPAVSGIMSGDPSKAFEMAAEYSGENDSTIPKYESTQYDITPNGWTPSVNVKGASETKVATSTLIMGAVGLIVLAKLAGGKN